jgi:hypothetical protein
VSHDLLQRKANRCACGGSCPRCRAASQSNLMIGEPDDQYEREADAVVDRVMRMADSGSGPVTPAVSRSQRKCVACEKENDEQILQAKTEASYGSARSEIATAPASVHEALNSPGQPLAPKTRAFFEPRFGHDFSKVRVHTGEKAARSARAIAARAYTRGHDIVLAEPPTRGLLAHELTHVVQQEGGSGDVVRRLSYGTGAPPVWTGRTLTVVPTAERAKVDEAIAIVDNVVNHPDNFRECHNHYTERCPGGGPGTLASVWSSATLWRITAGGEGALARGDVGGPNIAYTQSGYDQTVQGLAQTLMHEAGHNCGIAGGDPHWRADEIATYCMGTGHNILSPLFGGPYLSESGDVESAPLLLSYRRLLGDWASGHLNLTLGADLNFITTVGEIVEEASKAPEERRFLGEFGSVMVGLHGRVSPWGGPRYGGLTGRIETGFGAGRFALRPADPSERERTSIEASWVLQIGLGAEFALPDIFTEGRIIPLSVQAAYRLVQPLNGEAERLHGILGGVLEVGF